MTYLIHWGDCPDKECGKCGLIRKGYSPDPCIGGYLPGVAHACCGHESGQPYVVGWPNCEANEVATDEFGNRKADGNLDLRGQDAADYINANKHLVKEEA